MKISLYFQKLNQSNSSASRDKGHINQRLFDDSLKRSHRNSAEPNLLARKPSFFVFILIGNKMRKKPEFHSPIKFFKFNRLESAPPEERDAGTGKNPTKPSAEGITGHTRTVDSHESIPLIGSRRDREDKLVTAGKLRNVSLATISIYLHTDNAWRAPDAQ